MKRKKGEALRQISLFERFDAKDEEKIILFVRRAIFVLLLFAEAFILLQQAGNSYRDGGYDGLVIALASETILTVVEALKSFALKKESDRTLCYVAEFVAVFALTSVVGNAYLCPLYILILTELYLHYKMFPSVLVCAVCMLLFVVTFWGTAMLHNERISVLSCVTQSVTDFVVLFVHFLLVNVALRFYRQYVRLKKTLKELDESKKKLQKAYDELAQATVLAERQRIAKNIHDVAGHSITTVIVQTEAAKLVIDEDPKEAKNKLIAANLQAKQALEALRESVHLLSGRNERELLSDALGGIVRETTDGTGIRIRSKIDDVLVDKETFRLLCNGLREGISNGIRHGGATAFWFELKEEQGVVSFLLSDNGKGAARENIREGFGLSSMREETERLGGKMQVYSAEDEGFEVSLKIPKKGDGGTWRTALKY